MSSALVPQRAAAQEEPIQIDILTVAIWPEYDRPDILVVYRLQLGEEAPLPAELSFRLPSYIQEMHAVAYEDSSGSLVSIDPADYELRQEGDATLLTAPVAAPRLQFEYYDPQMLKKEGDARQFTFDFIAPYAIAKASFEVQEPYEAQNFTLTPEPKSTITGGDRLHYHIITTDDLAAGDPFPVSATYQRSTDATSLDALVAEAGAGSASPPADATAGGPTWVYWLVGAVGLLLLAGAGYWWWNRRAYGERSQPPAAPRVRYCHNCGAPLREGVHLCHACGAEIKEPGGKKR